MAATLAHTHKKLNKKKNEMKRKRYKTMGLSVNMFTGITSTYNSLVFVSPYSSGIIQFYAIAIHSKCNATFSHFVQNDYSFCFHLFGIYFTNFFLEMTTELWALFHNVLEHFVINLFDIILFVLFSNTQTNKQTEM